MKLLALDTATEVMAVALVDGPAHVGRNTEGGAQASAQLLPQTLAMLAERGWAPATLQAVAFGQGPGAFTGLRTAVSAAQGLALGIGCPVLPIDSLMIVAEDARAQAQPAPGTAFDLWVAMDARMDEVYAAAYRHDGQQWHTVVAPALYDLPTLATRWQAAPPQQLAGSALSAFGARLPVPAALTAQWPLVQDRAAALAVLARAAWASGPHLAADEALPVYLRDKVALTTAEREAAKRAAGAGA